ncbi:MAG: hypothetical protein CR217_05430 [Beijerinckiaceae bacterium]|nr:MAG: hypothetical protein CR217_05430 [Beijerinckiaceae bacterium]
MQIAFNARHSPNESKGSPDGVLPAASSITVRSAVIGCEAKIDRGQLRSGLTIRLSFVGVPIYVSVWSSPFRPNLRAAARCIAAPFPLNLAASIIQDRITHRHCNGAILITEGFP